MIEALLVEVVSNIDFEMYEPLSRFLMVTLYSYLIHVCMYVYVCVYVCVYICMYVCMC